MRSEAQCVMRLGIGKNKNIRHPDYTTAVNKSEQDHKCSSEDRMKGQDKEKVDIFEHTRNVQSSWLLGDTGTLGQCNSPSTLKINPVSSWCRLGDAETNVGSSRGGRGGEGGGHQNNLLCPLSKSKSNFLPSTVKDVGWKEARLAYDHQFEQAGPSGWMGEWAWSTKRGILQRSIQLPTLCWPPFHTF